MRYTLTILLALTCLTAGIPQPGHPSDPAISVSRPWLRALLPGRPAAGYMIIKNKGSSDDQIVSAHSPMAKKISLHTHLMKKGVMKMRTIDTIDLPAKAHVELKPHGLHFMVTGLSEMALEYKSMPLTLVFKHAGEVTINVPIIAKLKAIPSLEHSPPQHTTPDHSASSQSMPSKNGHFHP